MKLFLSSGAAATIIAKAPAWVPVVMATAAAAMTAYAIAAGLDRKVATMVKLSSSWREIEAAYDRLWNHTYDEDAEDQFDVIVAMERGSPELAQTDAPLMEDRLEKSQQRVVSLHGLTRKDA